ncbi:MAG TPA: hypothetical protein VFJ78_00175 [Gaiellaceae bacterium]|nr:hypothetical protein [Gaiellaceae bacterium]
MSEIERDEQSAPTACVRCGSTRTVAGVVLAEGEIRFLPRGLRWWKRSGVPVVSSTVQACLDCGCFVGGVDPFELRAKIESAGGDELRAVLGRARPRPSSSGSRGDG